MATVYERGKIRKTQYAQSSAGNWYCRSIGGKRPPSRWTRVRDGWTPNLDGYEAKQMHIMLPRD